ncbi:hypothetical protein KBC79_06685, partial [Candidatus Woesebacteria bacterium]|nr:hypothetical protein [Candidatus Woesebacteria bacterium]
QEQVQPPPQGMGMMPPPLEQMGMPPQVPMQPPMGMGQPAMPQGMSQYQPSGNQEVDQIMQEIINGNRTA